MNNNRMLINAIDLMTEWKQCLDEGKDVAKYHELCEKTNAQLHSGNKDAFDIAVELTNTMANAPQVEGYEFIEPSTLDEIKAVRPKKRHNFTYNLTAEEFEAKIVGAWTGRIAGCLLGKPVEGWKSDRLHKMLKATGNFPMTKYITQDSFTDEIIKEFDISKWACWADKVNGIAPVDDDTNYTTFALKILEVFGKDFTPRHIIESWMNWIPAGATYTAERIAYRNFMCGMNPPETATHFNPCREYIGAQIRGDFFGYINPANTEKAAEYAWRDASVSHIKNGIYGEMYIAAMLAAGAVCGDVMAVIEAGLDEIPEKSRLRRDVEIIIDAFRSGKSYDEAIAIISSAYDEHFFYGWCHTNSNAMIVTAALLYGNLDYGKSICMAVQPGFDTDCNGATVGSIVGMIKGISSIPEYWQAPFNGKLRTSIEGYMTVTVEDMSKKTIKIAGV